MFGFGDRESVFAMVAKTGLITVAIVVGIPLTIVTGIIIGGGIILVLAFTRPGLQK